MKTFLQWMLCILDPGDCTRRYSVSYGDYNGGMFKCFWFKRNAIKFAKSRYEQFVDIYDDSKHPYGGMVKSIWSNHK